MVELNVYVKLVFEFLFFDEDYDLMWIVSFYFYMYFFKFGEFVYCMIYIGWLWFYFGIC